MKKFLLLLALVATVFITFTGCNDDDATNGFLNPNAISEKDIDKAKEIAENVRDSFDPNNPDAKEHIEYVKETAEVFSEEIEHQIEANEEKTDERIQDFRDNQTKISNVKLSGEDFDLKLKSFGISDFYDSKAITITADFTNNNEDYDLGVLNIINNLALYQDGVRINHIFTEYDMNIDKSIKAGKTIEIAFSYELDNETADIEIEATGPNGVLVDTCSFKIK